MKKITVADTIEHLKTLPQDMEVWAICDESGEYSPVKLPQGRIDYVIKTKRNGRIRWETDYDRKTGKKVCIL